MDDVVKVALQETSYTVILVRYAKNSPATQDLWITKKKDCENAIYVKNIPHYCSAEQLKSIFSKSGLINDITFEGKRGKTPLAATIKFKNKVAMLASLSMKYDDGYTISTEKHPILPMHTSFVQELQNEYNIDKAKLLDQCTAYMKAYDNQKEHLAQQKREQYDHVDEEGWTTVTRTRNKSQIPAVKEHDYIPKHIKKPNEHVHFYTNKGKNEKTEKLRALKMKFEEDKKRIQIMRENRKFKPY